MSILKFFFFYRLRFIKYFIINNVFIIGLEYSLRILLVVNYWIIIFLRVYIKILMVLLLFKIEMIDYSLY